MDTVARPWTRDWLIDLGPEGGGALVAEVAASHTGRYLKPLLAGREVRRA